MRDIRRGSAWPDSRPAIVAGGGLDLPARPRPGHSFPERAGMGGGITIFGGLLAEAENTDVWGFVLDAREAEGAIGAEGDIYGVDATALANVAGISVRIRGDDALIYEVT